MGGAWAYLTNSAAGGAHVVLVDPGAFGASGVKYALATAGGEEPMEEGSSSDETESESDGSESAVEPEGEPELPEELRNVAARQEAERERLRAKRATRLAVCPTQ